MSAEDSNTSANDAAASNTGTAVEGGSSTAPDLASESPAVAPSPSPDDGSVVSPLKSLRPSRPRPSLMISASAAQSERENVSKNVPHSARQAGDASKSVHTHASLSATAPVLHRSASGTVLAAKEATGAESNEKVETPQSARLPSAQSARTPGRTSIIVSPGPARTQHQIALNESIRAARQLSHNMKSKVAAEREALMKKEEAEAAKLAQQREEESNNKRLEYDWRSLLSKHPDDRDEEEVLYLLHWVISLRIEFLLNLPREILMTLCKHFQLEQFQPDTYVFEQGDEGQKFYVILKGSVGVHIKEDEEDAEEHRKEAERKAKEAAAAAEAEALNPTTRKRGKTHGSVSVNNPLPLHVEKPKPGAPKEGFVEVMTMHVGGAFGEVALISSNEKRSASIKTKEESMFLTIDKATYALALKDKANQERNRRETFVRNHIFFRRLVNEKQNSLISSLKEKIYSRNSVIVREGEEIVREGESSSQIFFVAQGCVLIKKMIRPHVMAINVLAKQNQQYKVSDMHSASATQDDAFKNTISMPSIPPTTIRGHLNTTAAAGGGSGDNNATGAGASNAEGELHHHAAAINRAGSVGATRRALGAASKTDAGAHIPFSTATHGYGAAGGSNLETFSQVVELGRIGPGSFFAEEGILDLQSEFRDYSVVADEVKVVVYALDRVAFHKSIKGNVLGMLQEMALKKKELRQKRIEALIRSYISASEQGAMLGSNAMGAPMYSPRNNGKQRLTRPQPPALPPSNANGAAANSTSSASSTTLSIFHVPNRTKPVNIRSFGIVRHAGAVPQILNDDDSDQFHSGPSAMEDEEDYWSEEEKQTHQEQARATTPIARRGHRGSAPWEDVELTLATVEHAATATATGSKDASNRSIAHSRRSSRGSMVSLLESAQTRSIPPATAAAAAVARRNRSRSRSRSRSKSAHRRPHPPTSTSATDRSSRPSSRGGNNEEYENVSEANPPLAPAVISVVPAPSSATSAPPPLVTSAVMHQLLGTKSAVTPLALLTQSSIPLSALSALSPHPLPPLMPINVKEELEKKLREEELARAAKLMQKKQKAEIRSRSRQNSIVDSRTNLLEQKLQEALVMNEIREEETQHLGTLNHPASSSAPVSPKDQLSDSDSGSDSDSDSDSDDDSDDSDDDLIEREIGDSPADLPTSVSPTKLEKLRAELEAREAWKTSPRRLSVLSRLIGIGTGHGTQRVVDQETGTIVSDISQHAKQIEAVVGHGKQQELKRRHIMAHLQRSEPNTARTFSKDSSTASSRQSSRPVSPHKSAGLNGTMTMGLQQVAETPQKEHEEEEKRDGNETPATGEKSKPATLKSPRGIHSITSSDPLLRGPSFTSRSFAPCLYGSAGHGTTSSPASLSPFVHATGAAIQAMQYSRKASLSHDEKAGVVPSPQSAPAVPGTPSSLTAPVLLEDARKHRFVPIASSPRNRSWDPSLTPRNSELAAATSTSFPTITSPRTPYVIVRKRNPPTPGGGSNFFASASGSSAISTRRPYHSISRAGLVSFGLGKVNLEEAAAELAQNQANGGMDAAAPFFHYTHTSTASVSLSAPSPRLLSGASGNLGSNIAAAAAAASPSHTAVSPASIPVSPFSPSSSLSGPSLLPASSVAAIERYLHHQLQLEHESFGLASDSARRKRKKGNTLNRGFPPTELNIHKLEELATRSHRRAQFDGVAVASRSTVSTTTEDSPAPPQAAAPVAPGTPSQLPSRRITPFAVSALLNGETSVAVPPRIPKSYRPVPIYHHLKNQLLDRI